MLATGRAAASFDNGQKLPSEPRLTLWSRFLRLRCMDLIVTPTRSGDWRSQCGFQTPLWGGLQPAADFNRPTCCFDFIPWKGRLESAAGLKPRVTLSIKRQDA